MSERLAQFTSDLKTALEPSSRVSIDDWFSIAPAREKIASLPQAIERVLNATSERRTFWLARDVNVVPIQALPPKLGLSNVLGQGRLLHDLANIEIQAMELAVRTLYEFPEAPREFREQLASVALQESRHLELCLDGLEALGFKWGAWDVHLALWNTVGPGDDILDRILIVHRYLEGSGLDAGASLLRRLAGVSDKQLARIVKIIVDEEVDHVRFGSEWYRHFTRERKLDADHDFRDRIRKISEVAPRRERIARDLRFKAGFTLNEIELLEALSAK